MSELRTRTVASARPASSSNAERQRARILAAAEKCFIERGFHAASIAHIAQTAGISPGLIYRYFDSKALIVKAIIERHLETAGTGEIDRLNSPEDVCEAMLALFVRWQRGDDPKMNAGLLLDLSAECTRDPVIARVVRDKDRIVGDRLAQAVQRIAQARGVMLHGAEARERAQLLHCLVEGLACRVVRAPKLRRAQLQPMLQKMIGVLLA